MNRFPSNPNALTHLSITASLLLPLSNLSVVNGIRFPPLFIYMTHATKDNRAVECARGCLEKIKERVETLHHAYEANNYEADDAARETLCQNAYGIAVRSDWVNPGTEMKPGEYLITLAGGGPAARISGMLDEFGEPTSAGLEYQDWFEPWTPYFDMTIRDNEAILEYAKQFYFGD